MLIVTSRLPMYYICFIIIIIIIIVNYSFLVGMTYIYTSSSLAKKKRK